MCYAAVLTAEQRTDDRNDGLSKKLPALACTKKIITVTTTALGTSNNHYVVRMGSHGICSRLGNDDLYRPSGEGGSVVLTLCIWTSLFTVHFVLSGSPGVVEQVS